MIKYKLHTTFQLQLADQCTPVSLYLLLRDRYPGCVMLESSDYHGQENSLSYIAFEPIASFEIKQHEAISYFPDGSHVTRTVRYPDFASTLEGFTNAFSTDQPKLPFSSGGFFGHWNYEAAAITEDLELTNKTGYADLAANLPTVVYQVFKYVIVFRHFHNELYLIEHRPEVGPKAEPGLEIIRQLLLQAQVSARFRFSLSGHETSDQTDQQFILNVEQGIKHCHRGDVFQLVVSRSFSQAFNGDEFNVYRSLRSINPSPYLFYFDYGNYKIFGSSPEAQLLVKGQKTEIHPIAGTFRRTGDDDHDRTEAQRLLDDAKENAEHVMLVDLARNDLNRFCDQVAVEKYREVQFYSHVIHLVSKVSGQLLPEHSPLEVAASTFPAGTLSGAPKHEAMKIINRLEPTNRGFYGGAIGLIDWDGNFNHAIIIRSFFSKDNVLHYRAGAGVVAKSNPEHELQEVHNKLGALKKALQLATTLTY